MRRPKAIGWAAALLLGSLGVPGSAQAFTAQGQAWPNAPGTPVSFRLHPSGSDDVTDASDLAAIRRGFAKWEQVACSYLAFREDAWMDPRTVNNDGVNRIMWVEDEAEWPGQSGTLALTYSFYTLDAERNITDADMIFNGVHWRWTTVDAEIGTGTPAKVDIETVAFHEIGHFFGLDHSQDPAAAMYPSNNKPKQRDPASDDVNGICTLYPNGQQVPGGGAGMGTVGAPCQDGSNCASGLCVEDELISRTYCTANCNRQDTSTCPAGYVCEETQQGSFCFAPAPVDELCDLCSDGAQCASGLCVTVPFINENRPFCSRACDPTEGQPLQCPSGFQCRLTQQGTTQLGACVPNTGICDPQGKGGQAEPCYGNGACKPGLNCVEYYPNSGLNFCYAACPVAAAGQPCGLPRTTCLPVAGQNNVAVCFPISDEDLPCIPEICPGYAWCAWDENAGIDSATCYRVCQGGQENCKDNYQCTGIEGLPPLCIANDGFKQDGEACTSDSVCISRTCRTYGNAKLCTQVCSKADPSNCAVGMRCVTEPASDLGLCWPTSFIDRNSPDPVRGAREIPPTYCACDTTVQCDDDCPCDPECEGSTCSCTSSQKEGDPLVWIWGVLGAAGWLARRRR